MELVTLALALGLGFLLGVIVGARRAITVMLSGRAVRTTRARLASYMPVSVTPRSAEDILAGRVRIVLGPEAYELPVLPRAASRQWLAELDGRFAALAVALDEHDTPGIMSMLAAETDALYQLLLSYDQSHILPTAEVVDQTATDAQVLHAVLEVWRAAHPLADNLITASNETSGTLFAQPNGQLVAMAGAPITFNNSPTSSSSPTPTQPKTE